MTNQSTLGEVLLRIETGKSFQTSELPAGEDQLGVLKVSAVTWSAFRPDEAKLVLDYEPDPRHRVKSNDLIMSRANTQELVGAVVLVDRDYPCRILSDKTLRLVVDTTRADKLYLLYALRSKQARKYIEEHATGTSSSMRNIGQDTIEAIPVALPDLKEQQRIAANLNALFDAINSAKSALQKQLAETKCVIQAVIRESVEHPDTLPTNLGDVLEEVKEGIGASWSKLPVLGATRDGLALAREPVGKRPERYKPVVPGTVFYNPMRIMIGSIAMVDIGDPKGITSPDYVVLRGRKGKVDSRWFYYWLRAPEGERCISSLARGAVRERMLFNRLAEGEIELPPFPVQENASRALAEAGHMRAVIRAQLQDVEKMPTRILARTFEEENA